MSASTDNTSELMAPVLLEFGKTIYVCQCFEYSLCLLLSFMEPSNKGEGKNVAFQTSWDFHSKKTLGALLKVLREKIEVPEELDQFLSEGVAKRNEVVHGFFTRNAVRLASPKERLEIEQELATLKGEIKSRDIVVNKLLDALLKNMALQMTNSRKTLTVSGNI